MDEDDLGGDVRRILLEDVDSVEQLEALLLLQSEPDRRWSADEVARRLYVQSGSAARSLLQFQERGYLNSLGSGPETLYFYSPRDAALDTAVRGLARAYRERRVRVISLVFGKPSAKVRTFAEAFRIREEK